MLEDSFLTLLIKIMNNIIIWIVLYEPEKKHSYSQKSYNLSEWHLFISYSILFILNVIAIVNQSLTAIGNDKNSFLRLPLQ